MYILKNSWKNLRRNKGRNFMVLMIALLTLTSVTLSFSIKTISDLAVTRYKNSFGVQANITVDWEKFNNEIPPVEKVNADGSISVEQNYELPAPELADYLKYADSAHVKRTLYDASVAFASDTLIPVPNNLRPGAEIVDIGGMTLDELKKFFNEDEAGLKEIFGSTEELQKVMDTKRNCIGTLWGFTDLSLLTDFTEGKRKLEQGEFPGGQGECIVSTVFAKQNNLEIGDAISVSGPNKADTEEITLKVTGIYADYFSEASAAELGMIYADVITTFDTVMNSGFHDISVNDATFVLNTPDDAPLFLKEIHDKGLNEYYTLAYSTEDYEANTKPLKNISRIAKVFTLTAGVIGAAILLLISCFNIRERKYEIGVLRAMGMKKAGVAKGMVYETLMLMFISFVLSVFLGGVIAKPMTAALLGNLEGVNKTLPPVAILFSACLSLAFSVLAGFCSLFAVMRHEPMRILMERD